MSIEAVLQSDLTIKEIFDESIEHDLTDLQALLMFLLFEKQVININDKAEVLRIYFKKNNQNRLNKLLEVYKKEMNIKYQEAEWIANNTITKAHSKIEARLGANAEIVLKNDFRKGENK